MCIGSQNNSADLVRLFEDDKVTSGDDLEKALLAVGQHLCSNCYSTFLRKALDPPPAISRPLLGIIFSHSDNAQALEEWLVRDFPKSIESYSNSIHAFLFEKLSIFDPFDHQFERDLSLSLHRQRTSVEYSLIIIRAVLQIRYKSTSSSEVNDYLDDEDPIFVVTKKRPQRQRKDIRLQQKIVFDGKTLKALEFFEFGVPSANSANEIGLDVLSKMAEILQTYLQLLRSPEVKHSVLLACFAQIVIEHGTPMISPKEPLEVENVPAAVYPTSGKVDIAIAIRNKTPEAYPLVQPMKAALYFDSIEGFGEWRILISTRADRDLREARRSGAKFFRIIIKKIKELSNGHFSNDNQKRLNGHDTEVPIYEAKMTRDSRLVYQIDCIPEYDSDVERQVIKIFGVYTHAQIDKRLWDSVGYQLARRGRQYRQRCSFRNPPAMAGDNVYTPACFPPPDKNEEDDYILPELPQESLEEMHSVLVLEKFVTFSQALFNSIIADLDVAHVFNVSPQEKEIVEYPFSCYVLGRSGTGKTTTMLFKMLGIERAYASRKDSMPKLRQIFVTKSRMLAGKVEEYFVKLLDSLATGEKTREELAQIVKSTKQKQDNGLIDIDDDQHWKGDLPQKFSELRDEHFPLFLTFDHLASLLEKDILELTYVYGSPKYRRDDRRIITYDVFLQSYWPHFSQNLTKGLDPALVFSELMGVIQGSEESLWNENGFVEKELYSKLSHRTRYVFASRRDTIYSIFLDYIKRKKSEDEYDAADKTHRILQAFKKYGIPGQKIDFLYVDEAQDNLLIDAFLLRSLVRNPDGLFWAGDTAQTISIGSSFRFNDLKAFLYRLEKRREESLPDVNSAATIDVPRSFHLSVNYRSHGGIVQCAHSIIELITKFWPHAIDVLSKERGVVDGSKPVFFSGWDSDTVRYEQFLFGESGNPIEFGAQQCILVRDEVAREDLRKQVGEIGLIMTLYESKGLEFDDVLLYKFFEDSTIDYSQWRVVLNLIESQSREGLSAPQFDEIRHAGVCSELKFLYVAITRARKNLWLVDCSEKGEPMRQFWTSRNEIQNCTPGTDVPRLAVSSSPAEWENSGRVLFQNKRYLQAMHCFERAGLNREVAVSRTYYLREQARSMPSTGSKQTLLVRHDAFIVAAEAFLECSAVAINPREKRVYFRNAGDCFERVGEEYKAANAYACAAEYNTAVKLFRRCAKFDEAVEIVLNHRPEVESTIASNLIDVARLFYFKAGELEKTIKLFSSVEEQLEYLEDFDLDTSRAALLEQLGRFQQAAEIHFEEGRIPEAISLFLKDRTNKESLRKGMNCILQGLWERASFGVKVLDKQAASLLAQASKASLSDSLKADYLDELLMFESIHQNNSRALCDLGKKFFQNNQNVNALLCYEHVFQSSPNLHKMTSAEISDFLDHFIAYCDLVQEMIHMPNPIHFPGVQKLFRIVPSSEGLFLIPTGSFLHNKILESRILLSGSNEQGLLVSEYELSSKFKNFLLQRLTKRILVENDGCKQAQAFRPCPSFVVNNQCNRVDCPRQHIKASSMVRGWYSLQMKIHLQQMFVVQILCAPPCHPLEKMKNIRYWIGSLYETLYPIWYQFGSIANFDINIPESRRAFAILRQWCFDILYWPGHRADAKLLTTFYQAIKLYHQLEQRNAFRHLMQSQVYRQQIMYYRQIEQQSIHIIPELIAAITTVNDVSVSRGVFFVRQVIDKSIPIDATLLCGMIEFLCGSIILVRNKMDVHNVNLPLSWLKIIFPLVSLDPKKHFDVNPVVDGLLSNIQKLIEDIYSANGRLDYLLVENSDLNSVHGHRNIYVARLCRSLCLVGYNINNDALRSQIIKCLRGLKRPSNIHNLVKPYAFVTRWTDVSRLVPKFTSESSLDQMIQLYYEIKLSTAKSPPSGIRRVVYKNVVELERQLKGLQPAIISNLRADAPEFVPKPRLPQAPVVDEVDDEVEEPEVDNSEIVNTSTTSTESIPVDSLPEAASVEPSEEQVQAARKLQAWYREQVKHRPEVAKTAVQASRNSCFEACMAESTKIEWPKGSYYRLLFLGPLPHILVCLNAAYTWAMGTKRRNKQRYKTAAHQELEDVVKRLNEQRELVHEIQRLRKALSPTSDLHRRRDVEELKARVLEVRTMLRMMSPHVEKEVEQDLGMGLKGIVEEKKKPKPKSRPELGIDDDGECDAYGEEEEDHEVIERANKVEEDSRSSDHLENEEERLHQGTGIQLRDDGSASGENKAVVNVFISKYEEEAQASRYHPFRNVSSTIIQSLPWFSMNNMSPEQQQHQEQTHPAGHTPAGHVTVNSDEESDVDGLVMQSLSWIPI